MPTPSVCIGASPASSLLTRVRARDYAASFAEDTMPQRGDIVVERLTGKRVIVIKVAGDEIMCRFDDGRKEERFAFELESSTSAFGAFLSLIASLFRGRFREAAPGVNERVRPLVLRQPGDLQRSTRGEELTG